MITPNGFFGPKMVAVIEWCNEHYPEIDGNIPAHEFGPLVNRLVGKDIPLNLSVEDWADQILSEIKSDDIPEKY